MWLLEADEFYSVVKINLALTLALFHALASSPSASAKRIRKCTIKIVAFINTKKGQFYAATCKASTRGKQG